jgi:rhodanese-related sulfurtransferase
MQATMTQIPDPAKAKAYFEEKMLFTTGPIELERMIRSGENHFTVVDVREAEDYAKGHVPGAINLPKEKWESLQGLQKNKTNIVYCYNQTCHLAANACRLFASKGCPVMEMDGGFKAWRDFELDIEPEPMNRLRK